MSPRQPFRDVCVLLPYSYIQLYKYDERAMFSGRTGMDGGGEDVFINLKENSEDRGGRRGGGRGSESGHAVRVFAQRSIAKGIMREII